ncbi:MAG TPA: HNH endonuclease [Ktedonobacteraceae bacterium]|nr:HNH endonuclease [Ktedonobacteraceae bacterium]
MHRQIMWRELERRGAKFVVDHINGDKLDNRRANLRVGKQGRNIMNNYRPRSDNTSGIVGVYFDAAVKRWKAVCGRDYLGSFDSKEEAALIRKKEVERRGGRHSVRLEKAGVEVSLVC